MISISHYLYRKSGRHAIAALLTVALLGFGMSSAAQVLQDHTHQQQQPPPDQNHGPAKNAKRGARAIGVVEFLPGGGTRLVPIAIWIDDRFYDASLYAANPEPLAVEPQTVYQATDYGEPTGLFTVVTPKEVNGSWVADGRWTPHLAMDEKLAQQASKQPKKKVPVNPDDDRPVLHRSGSSGSSGSGNSGTTAASSAGSSSTAANSPPPANDDPDRPTLKNSSPSPTTAAPASGPTPSNNAPNATGTAPASSSPAASSDTNENDPGRPLLRRGKQAEPDQPETAQASSAKAPTPTEAARAKLVNTITSLGHHSYPAISDAGKYEMRSLLYAMGSSERVDKSQEMSALALDDIRKFISQRKTPALAKTATITDYDLRAFDLDYSNSPTLVFTATLPVDGAKALRGGEFTYYVTVVAREDINGTPIKIFSSVTDSNHLDAFSRMEIIDAVDADANGRGVLLFRQYSDTGINYGLYRVFPYQMQKIFEGGSGI